MFSKILTDTPGKMFELISGHPPFTDLVPETSSLIPDWIELLGDLPKEWGVDSPPKEEYGMFWAVRPLSLFASRHQSSVISPKRVLISARL